MLLEDRIRPGHWYRDRLAWRFIALVYLPLLAALNLLWEMAQLPLYTLWKDAPLSDIVFAVVHCTVGDAAIGVAAFVIALVATDAGPIKKWKWLRIALIAVSVAVAYTALSEWMNTAVKSSWQYSDLMPTLEIRGIRIGLSPLAQWLILPPCALVLARLLARQP